MARWTEIEEEFLSSGYFSYDQGVLENSLNRSWKAIKSKALAMNLKRPNEANTCNFQFFDNWSEDMAYLLGFICADGNIYITNRINKISISLAYSDINHVEKIRDILCPKKKIYISDIKLNGKMFRQGSLQIGSKYMCNRLVELGINPNKSLSLRPIAVPDKYTSDFIRGYFDGDGSIYKIRSTGRWQVEFSGTKAILEYFSEKINEFAKTGKKNVRPNHNIYRITYSTNDALKLYKWMYGDARLFLDRKYNKFQHLLGEIRKANR